MLHFTTYFDKNYLARGLVLYDSLAVVCPQFRLYILCLDAYTADYFRTHSADFPQVSILTLNELEAADGALEEARKNRSLIEYYFTLSPCLPLHLLKQYQLPHICSLDADMLFLSDPAKLFAYLNDYSIIITPHKFSPELRYLDKFGRYNVSFQIFKNDQTGTACLEEWRRQCLEWCGDTYDAANDRFADQKYLDDWIGSYPGKVKELDDAVSGIAPWNLNNYKISRIDGQFFSNGEKIIFYHFHHFKMYGDRWISNVFDTYFAKWQKRVEDLYFVYWEKIIRKRKILQEATHGSVRSKEAGSALDFLLRQKSVYYRWNEQRHIAVSLKWIPSFLRAALTKQNG